MLIIAVVLLSISTIMICFSLWGSSKIIILLAFVGTFLLGVYDVSERGYIDFLFVLFEITAIELVYYFVMSHKIMNKKSNEAIYRNSFLLYLKENDLYRGYKKLVYQTPNLIFLSGLAIIIIHISRP